MQQIKSTKIKKSRPGLRWKDDDDDDEVERD